jgi:hypothetical protein
MIRRERKSPVALICRSAIASIVLSALAQRKLENHKRMGSQGCFGNHERAMDQDAALSKEQTSDFGRLLNGCIITNTVAACTQLSGAIIYSGFSLAGKQITAGSRRSTLLVCFTIPSLV